MPAECKVLTCCDLDDFPQTSTSNGNCPVGYHWNGSYCIPGECVMVLNEDGSPILGEDGLPICSE